MSHLPDPQGEGGGGWVRGAGLAAQLPASDRLHPRH